MEKNNFLIYNDIVYTLYQCKSYEALRDEFLPKVPPADPIYLCEHYLRQSGKTELRSYRLRSAFLIISMKQNCSTSII